MRKMLIIIFLIQFVNLKGQEFYYYKNEKIQLKTDIKNGLLVTKQLNKELINKIENDGWKIIETANYEGIRNIDIDARAENYNFVVLTLSIDSTKLIKNTQIKKSYEYENCFFSNFYFNSNIRISPLPQIYVELNNEADYDILSNLSKSYNFEILGRDGLFKNFIIIRSKFLATNSLQLSKKLYETNLFKSVTPDFKILNGALCSNEPKFQDQWNLLNIGQNGGTNDVDIKVCNAWNTTKGSPNIKIGVIDYPIELSHSDINLNAVSYNAVTNSSPSGAVIGNHGTACAGIISAKENGIGVVGISPNSSIVGIGVSGSISDFVSAFNYASTNGIDVINLSWRLAKTAILDQSISNALYNGRNGKGCVIVCSSGNGLGAENCPIDMQDERNTKVAYPASLFPEILAVGAVDRCGTRSRSKRITSAISTGLFTILSFGVVSPDCIPTVYTALTCAPWPYSNFFSQFGDELDIVAPSDVPTTTLKNGFINDFGGTSAAAPHVSGVAALILSVNPCLTQSAVHDIICKSGQKLPSYSFANTLLRDPQLGLWNEEVGHGLVDVSACVNMASALYLQNNSEVGQINYLFSKIEAGENVDPYNFDGLYIIEPNADITLRATESVLLRDGFHAKANGNFHAKIETNAPCHFSNPILKISKVEKPYKVESVDSKGAPFVPTIQLYPNPTQGIVKLNFEIKENSNIEYIVSSMEGKVLFSESFNKEKGTHLYDIAHFLHVENGTYLIKICINTYCQTYKIIKNDAD